MSKKTFTYDKAAKLKKNTFKKSGYSFAGWNTAADGSGTPYENAASVLNLLSENNGNIVLYAQWKKN